MTACSTTLVAPDHTVDGRRNLLGMNLPELTAELQKLGQPAFRAKQLFHAIYVEGHSDFATMSNLAKDLRAQLAQTYALDRPRITTEQISTDGTRKWLLSLPDGNEVEAVYIPESDRGTLCVSSQVGCTLTCKFCHTGTQKLVRNLTPGEIIAQIMVCRDSLGEWPNAQAELRRARTELQPYDNGRLLTNIVLMGMGEPLYNFENVKSAMLLAMDPGGLALSKRRITLSTSGVVPMMQRCGDEIGVQLAVSLHAVRDELRDILVPLNKKYNLAQLLQACRDYPTVSNIRRITFEYVMLRDVNDSDADARELARLLRDIPAKVNLIPFNPWPGTIYECSNMARIEKFADIVVAGGISAPIRRPRGRDILAACGQLKSASEKQRASARFAATGLVASADVVAPISA